MKTDGRAGKGLYQRFAVALSPFGASADFKDPRLPKNFTKAVQRVA